MRYILDFGANILSKCSLMRLPKKSAISHSLQQLHATKTYFQEKYKCVQKYGDLHYVNLLYAFDPLLT